jgi:cysteine synthase A
MAEEFAAAREDVFLPRQFANQANTEAHEMGTGPEIAAQMGMESARPHAFVAGVGTGGTVMGVGRFLRTVYAGIKVHAVEPRESPTLSTGHRVGKHRIQGISDEFVPALVDLQALDEVIAVADGDAILMAQKLASRLGLAVGISSGCNLLAALDAGERLGPDAVVVTVLADDNKKYLSTDLMREEPVSEGYLTPEVDLVGMTAARRVCAFCEGAEG